MGLIETLFLLVLCVLFCVFLSLSEIALAASRQIKLQLLSEEGDKNADKILALQASPGRFFTAIQIGLNTAAILGGMIGDSQFTPLVMNAVSHIYQGEHLASISTALSFIFITSAFILFADLMPKRLAMTYPESVALVIIRPLLWVIAMLSPLVWLFNGLANGLFKLFNVSTTRHDDLTYEDIFAVMTAGAKAGLLQREEYQLIENVFKMQSLSISAAMTVRDSIFYFYTDDNEESIKLKMDTHGHNKFLVCEDSLDNIKGYVNAKELFMWLLDGKKIDLKNDTLLHPASTIPDTLTIYEAMEYFKNQTVDFAAVVNEYGLVVGILTINDLMIAIMGEWAHHILEEQIVQRDENSWLVDGATPIIDVMRAFKIDEFPDTENYETMAGFIMYMLRKIPKRTEYVIHQGYKFEVVDIDNHKVDQLLVTRLPNKEK
ncbi:MAG: hemolysin family protein [Legionellales bacterium]|jgi:CBS domain containing-hemolysin-like protein